MQFVVQQKLTKDDCSIFKIILGLNYRLQLHYTYLKLSGLDNSSAPIIVEIGKSFS